jgi:hypothetical protein
VNFHGGDSGEKLSKKEILICVLGVIGIFGFGFVWYCLVAPWLDSVIIISPALLDDAVDMVVRLIAYVPFFWVILSQPIMWIKG